MAFADLEFNFKSARFVVICLNSSWLACWGYKIRGVLVNGFSCF